jgi:hypothetical protein
MGFLRKTFYTIVGIPIAAIAAEYFYTMKCREIEPTNRLIENCPLVARKLSQSITRLDRFERSVPLASLKACTDSIDETTLSRRFAKQIWLSRSYRVQQKICERVFKDKKEVAANLTLEEIERAKIQVGTDISQHLVLSAIKGSYIQFEPKVPKGVDFAGPGGVVCVDVSRRGENRVFAIECATIPMNTGGHLELNNRVLFYLHQVYARCLLEEGVTRVLHGGGE